MVTPFWALSLSFALHMIATLVWIGSLAVVDWLLGPWFTRSLDKIDRSLLFYNSQRRIAPFVWFSVLILIGTGLFQMSANPQYEGFFALHNRWSLAILGKHIFIGVMVILFAYQSWGLMPALSRIKLKQELLTGKESTVSHFPDSWYALLYQYEKFNHINLVLGLLVLTMTALARAAA